MPKKLRYYQYSVGPTLTALRKEGSRLRNRNNILDNTTHQPHQVRDTWHLHINRCATTHRHQSSLRLWSVVHVCGSFDYLTRHIVYNKSRATS
jgi:hypothetical protein